VNISEPKPFSSTHDLDFLCCPWERDPTWMRFKIGTCHGLWRSTDGAYEILVVDNEVPGNGHFEDVMEWFENSCRRDGKKLRLLEFFNDRFRRHLIEKRGFRPEGENAVKVFDNQ